MNSYQFNYNVPADYTISNTSNLFLPLSVTKVNGKCYVELKGEVLLSTLSLIESWNMIMHDAVELSKPYLDEETIAHI